MKAGCQNSRQARSMAHSSLAPPLRILQGRQMAPIQLDSITMLVNKLLVGHTRSISGPILRVRNFRLTAPSILCEKIYCLWYIKILCTSPCGIPRLLLTSFYARPHDANPLLTAPKKAVNKQWYCAQYLNTTHEWYSSKLTKGKQEF